MSVVVKGFPANRTTVISIVHEAGGRLELRCFEHRDRLFGEIDSILRRRRRQYRMLSRQYTALSKPLRPIPSRFSLPLAERRTLTIASPADENNNFLSSDR